MSDQVEDRLACLLGKISLQHISYVMFCSDIEAPFVSMR